MPLRILLAVLVALACPTSQAWATGPQFGPMSGGGGGVVANTCTAGDFFSAVDGSGNFTCSTPSGSGDVTAVGDCASGACFTGSSGTTLTGLADTTFLLESQRSFYVNVDTDNNSTSHGFFVGLNGTGSATTRLFIVQEAGQVELRNGTDLRLYETDDSNYVEIAAPALSSNATLTLPTSGGTIPSSVMAPLTLSAAGVLALTQNAGTDVTADLEEETHATEHSLGGTDPITVTNLASACSDGQVLGGTAGGTGVECQADVDTNTNAATICSGTTTYLDGEGNCDDISTVYLADGTGTVDATNLATDSVSADELNATGVEAELEAVLDLQDLQGAVTDAQVPNTITVAGWTRDIMVDYSAACDGSTDDSGELQSCIDAANTAGGGTCFVPATGTACVINADVTWKSNVNLICEPGAILQSGSGLTNAMLYSTGTVNNWRISGCTFSNNGKELPILKLTAALGSAGTNWSIDHNQFYWDYDGGATPGMTAFSYISAVCGTGLLGSTAGGCNVSDNILHGSATDAQNDSGIGVSGQGSGTLFAANFVISDNVVHDMGASCITDPMSISSSFQGVISGNAMYDCSDYGISLAAMNYSAVLGNVVAVNTSGAVGLSTTGNNNVVDGNIFTVATGQGLAIAMVNANGTRISNNYAAAGIHMTRSAVTGELAHPSVTNNVVAIDSCQDDPSDGGTLKACIYLENPTDASVLNNLLLGGFGTSGGSAIKLANVNTTASTTLGVAHVSDNVISLDADATGTEACIAFDGSGSTTAHWKGVTISNNTCSEPSDAQTIDYFVNLSSLADSNTNWQNVVYDANNVTVTTFQNGGNTANVTPQFRSTASGYIWQPKGFNDGFGFRSIHMMGDGNCGAATAYMGPISASGNNCSTTETTVDWSVGLNPVTFTNMTCKQDEDTTCTAVFTLRDDAGDTSATCTTTNVDTCAWTGTVTMAASSLAAIKIVDSSGCTDDTNVECDLTYTVD